MTRLDEVFTSATEYLIERKVAIEQVCKIEKGKKKPTIRNIRSLIRNWMEICYATNRVIIKLSASRGSFSISKIDNLTHETRTILFDFFLLDPTWISILQ